MLSFIIDNIYIGELKDAYKNQKDFEVFTVAKGSPFRSEQHYYPLVDGYYPKNYNILLDAIYDLIVTRQTYNGDIMVHCISGISRSSAIVTGYIMAKGYTLEEARNYVENQRTIANINPALLELLKRFEHDLHYNVQNSMQTDIQTTDTDNTNEIYDIYNYRNDYDENNYNDNYNE